jgi:recombination protein RecA
MAERVRVVDDGPDEDEQEDDPTEYFASQKSPLEFIDTGSTQLNLVCGGGWPLTRIVNIAGDEATGKTLLCIEASANFKKKWPEGLVFYREAESAFDEDYAAALGMPVDEIDFIDPENLVTIEDFYEDLCKACDKIDKLGVPGLYILDSLDALSDEEEMKRAFGKGSFGTQKAKDMSKLFRMTKQRIHASNMCLIIISQTRDKISDTGIPGKTKGGGKGINFYSSIILWLSHMETIEKTRNKIKRATGIRVRVRCSKNKISLPHRRCEFVITFGAGIDDVMSNIDWLDKYELLKDVVGVERATYVKRLDIMSDSDYWDEAADVAKEVVKRWHDADRVFMDEVRVKPR